MNSESDDSIETTVVPESEYSVLAATLSESENTLLVPPEPDNSFDISGNDDSVLIPLEASKSKKRVKCQHGKDKRLCKDCGGAGLCLPHGKDKRLCKDCGGTGYCSHGKTKFFCKVLNNNSLPV